MGSLPKGVPYFPTSDHRNLLQQVIDGSEIENLLVRSYKRSFNGFAAILNDQQRKKLASMNGLGPIPKKWRGVCAGGGNFSCNNKIIGARFYGDEYVSARDGSGHGTHVASTTGGIEVKDVSFYGLAKGTARGGVPSSRIATYKICRGNSTCSGDVILAAFDDAIADGVDIITISICDGYAVDFLKDPIVIGSFHAMEKGILTTQSAGNFGPTPSSVCSGAPWLVTVAATSIDRQFIDKIVLET
ncbi:subtilisin-like protease SBT4.13 [Medicago truncatula]|uniref:subtilisin-like protease SBT4.13 n=1 Tax=Medicago truncatula TaxID=3880 RepID=UPI000D2F480A|nr:subtilisin-like protease SBT4.13 [Medicago truncatula]